MISKKNVEKAITQIDVIVKEMANQCGLFRFDVQNMVQQWNNARQTIARKAADIVSGKIKNLPATEVIRSYLSDNPAVVPSGDKKDAIELGKSQSTTKLFIKIRGSKK